MLRARVAAWFRSLSEEPTSSGGRQAYHSDIRAIRPDVWATGTPVALGRDVERAMFLAGVSTRDFAGAVGIDLTPHLVTPVDDIVAMCQARARACAERAHQLSAELPPPNPWGRPPLPWQRANAREAQSLYRAASAWDALAGTLLSNRWDLG